MPEKVAEWGLSLLALALIILACAWCTLALVRLAQEHERGIACLIEQANQGEL